MRGDIEGAYDGEFVGMIVTHLVMVWSEGDVGNLMLKMWFCGGDETLICLG